MSLASLLHSSPRSPLPSIASDPVLLAGVDIGGTNVRTALVSAEDPRHFLVRQEAQTPSTSGQVIDLVAEMVWESTQALGVEQHCIRGLGCVSPGILDPHTGVVATAVNLGWAGVPLRDLLAEHTGLSVSVENDVNAGAMAEYRFRSAPPPHSLVYLTVSTGLACGVVLGGHVLYGAGNAAGEVGFLTADIAALDDPTRSLEALAGGAGLARAWDRVRAAQANGDGLPALASTAIDVYDAARDGHPLAVRLVAEATEGIALAASAICCVLNPEVLVLGGSIAEHEPMVAERVQAHLAASLPFAPRVQRARLGGDAPLLGAIAVAERIETTQRGAA